MRTKHAGLNIRATGLALVLSGAALLLGARPSVATAEVSIGAEQITLAAPGAGATITRDPFHISFTGPAGETVSARWPTPLRCL